MGPRGRAFKASGRAELRPGLRLRLSS